MFHQEIFSRKNFFYSKLPKLILAIGLMALTSERLLSAGPEDAEYFENRVRPLLADKCQSCHGSLKQQASLRLDTKAGVLSGGASGPAVVAGRLDESLLIQAVRREGLEMPPEESLSPDEVEVFEKWVRDGAYWPKESEVSSMIALGDQKAILEKAVSHWAFMPIMKPDVPAVPEGSDIRNSIDAFIVAKLVEQGLTPLPAADPRTLLRRVSFDVTGLPQQSKAIEAFVAKPDSSGFMDLVDGLLASKEFGQRWGRYWLDITRYADTQDWLAQNDPRYPFAYTFRDYVIRSINEDKPYDQFVREQIAADFLNDDPHAQELAALGMLTVGPRFLNNKLEQISDRMDVITRGLMGITVGCARCHDHKYDPISIEDFYSMYGVFDSTDIPTDMPTLSGSRKLAPELREEYEKMRGDKVKAKDDYILGLRVDAIAAVQKDPQKYFRAFFDTSIDRSIDVRGAITKHKVHEIPMTAIEDSLLRIIRDKSLINDSVLGPLVVGLSMSDENFQSMANKLLDDWTKPNAKMNSKVLAALKKDSPQTQIDLLKTYADLFAEVLTDTESTTIESTGEETAAVRNAFSGPAGVIDFRLESVVLGHQLLGGGRRALGDLDKAISEVDASHPGSPPRAMTVVDKETPVTPFVFLRGEPARRGDSVPRQFISFLEKGQPKPFIQGSGRLELANKIVDPSNPLTARVAVNRVWMKYFGRGLVETADDFGLRSSPPSHPELLDWLAASFIENGWSMKWLHRTIIESAAYQRTSIESPSNSSDQLPGTGESKEESMDPENVWLWRQNRKRLDFEATRDTMLAVSGELDRSLDGPSVKLTSKPFPLRRTVYAYVDRVDLDPMLKVFDFASPLASASVRSETTVPQHALFVMNHPFVIERATTIAAKVRPAESSRDLVNRGINSLFRRMLGRLPTAQERSAALTFVSLPAYNGSLKRLSPWSYGIIENKGPNANVFVPLPHWTGKVYQGSPNFPDSKYGFGRVTNLGGHPASVTMDFVRRFHVPADGRAKIAGKLSHPTDRGDGVIASIIVSEESSNEPKQVGRWTSFNNEVDTTVEPIEVFKGGTIDFIVNSDKSGTSDSFNWTNEIVIDFDGQSSTTWTSKDGFKPPAPPMMDGWEQLAQALMLTNEFIYID